MLLIRGNKKWLKTVLFFSIVFVMFLLFAHSSLAIRTLENDYPKIPLGPPFGNISLNDIQKGIPSFEKDPLSLLILYFYRMSVMVVGLIALGVVIMAGFKLLTSGANPGLRNAAKNQLQAALAGIVLLLGSWLLLSTINPELTILHKPGEAPGTVNAPSIRVGTLTEENPFFKNSLSIDANSALLGGIVAYDTKNFKGRSQVFFSSTTNLSGTWVGNDKIKSLRYNSQCEINLYENANFGGQRIELAPISGAFLPGTPRPSAAISFDANEGGVILTVLSPLSFDSDTGLSVLPDLSNLGIKNGGSWEDDISSFKILNPKECVGNAVTVYEDKNFTGRQKVFLTSDTDLDDDYFSNYQVNTNKINNKISSLAFSRDPSDITARLCEDSESRGRCKEAFGSGNFIDDFAFLDNNLSSVVLRGSGSTPNTQKALIIFEHPDFKGQSEIFIASDSNTENGNRGSNRSNGIGIGSLMVIGELQVELWEKTDFKGKNIRITNSLTNRACKNSFSGEDCLLNNKAFAVGGILYISKMDDMEIASGNGWADDVSSIKIINK